MKKIYLTPEVEWFVIAIEQGFAASQTQDWEVDPDDIDLNRPV